MGTLYIPGGCEAYIRPTESRSAPQKAPLDHSQRIKTFSSRGHYRFALKPSLYCHQLGHIAKNDLFNSQYIQHWWFRSHYDIIPVWLPHPKKVLPSQGIGRKVRVSTGGIHRKRNNLIFIRRRPHLRSGELPGVDAEDAAKSHHSLTVLIAEGHMGSIIEGSGFADMPMMRIVSFDYRVSKRNFGCP